MNVDLIKFVATYNWKYDNAVMIYSMEDYWQYLFHIHSLPGNSKEIYFVEFPTTRIIKSTYAMNNVIEIFLNKLHKSKVIGL